MLPLETIAGTSILLLLEIPLTLGYPLLDIKCLERLIYQMLDLCPYGRPDPKWVKILPEATAANVIANLVPLLLEYKTAYTSRRSLSLLLLLVFVTHGIVNHLH
jgi:hypothetical protein